LIVKSRKSFYGHVFFADIESLTDIKLGTREDQTKKINKLAEFITGSRIYKKAKKPIYLPTGDGAAVCFVEGPEFPMELALEVTKKLRNYNKAKGKKDRIGVRIGISGGTLGPTKKVAKNENYWGLGLNSAKRIMGFGDADHILMDIAPAKDLINRTNYYKKIIHRLGKGIAKHDEEFQIYSVYGPNLGNRNLPKDLVKSIVSKEEHGRMILEGFHGSKKQVLQALKNYFEKSEITKLQLKRKSPHKKQRRKHG